MRTRWQQSPALTTIETLLAVGVLVLGLGGLARVGPTLLRGPEQNDFLKYYQAAHALNVGQPLYQALAPVAGDEAASYNYVGAPLKYNYLYPPFLAALLRPLAILPLPLAKAVWYVLNLVFLVAAVVLVGRVVGVVRLWSVAELLLLTLLLPAVYDTLSLGQVNLLILLLIAAAWYCVSRRPRRTGGELFIGCLIGVAAIIKVYPLLLGSVLLVHRRFAALGALIMSIAVLGLGGIMWGGGWHTTQTYLQEVLPNTGKSFITSPQNQNIQAALYRLFAPNVFRFAALSATNLVTVASKPLANVPELGIALGHIGAAAIALITGAVVVRGSSRQQDRRTELLDWSCILTMLLLITPITWDHYYVLLVPPAAMLWYDRREDGGPRPLALLGAALLILLQRYWHWTALHSSSPLLMMFGCLGVLVIWLATLRGRLSC